MLRFAKTLYQGSKSLILLAMCAGCSALPLSSNGSTVDITVKTRKETNGGRPFYVVARSIDETSFLSESYQDIAGKVFASPVDPMIIDKKVVFPGQKLNFEVKQSSKKPVAIYFLFTDPGPAWKSIMSTPTSSTAVFELGNNSIEKQT